MSALPIKIKKIKYYFKLTMPKSKVTYREMEALKIREDGEILNSIATRM